MKHFNKSIVCWIATILIAFSELNTLGGCLTHTNASNTKSRSAHSVKKQDFIYIGFVGRKMIKPHNKKMEDVLEVYNLPPEVVVQLNRKHNNYRLLKRQKALLVSYKDSCRLYIIQYTVKYKYFYPQGLKKGMIISEKEFCRWDFTVPVDLSSPENVASGAIDTLELERNVLISGTNEPVKSDASSKLYQQENVLAFHPWDQEETAAPLAPYDSSFDHFADSIYTHLSDFSDYLGAQRIKLELFDQPLAASFYATMYIHYVDSIVAILKKVYKVKPGEYEQFIERTSEIITSRFKYGVNFLLWEGIRRDRLDCDNTAFLVYDIGKKMGIEVSIVFLWYHALVIIGDYAYETTSQEYYSKDKLVEKYSKVFLITSDPKKIHAFLTIFELSSYLNKSDECKRAKSFEKIRQRYFPDVTKDFKKNGYM